MASDSNFRIMRIALTTEYYYPHLGGVTEHVHNLALQLNALGHTAIVITSDMGDTSHDEPWVRRVGRSRVIFSNGSFARLTTGWHLTRSIRDILIEESIDVVHIHGGLAPVFGIVAQDAADELNIPVVATFHSWFRHSNLYRVFRKPCQARLDRYAASIAVSQPVIDAHSQYFDTEWHIIPNGIDTDLFKPNGHRPQGDRSTAPQMLFLGRLDPRNGLDTLLKAMPSIVASAPDAHLVVAGDGPLRSMYERMAKPVAASVSFIGRVNGDRPYHYGAADMYLCPTTRASFGITLLEAMACSTPLLASDITGFRELVDGGHEAMLVPMSVPEAWAEASLEIARDNARRSVMGHAGREKALKFSWPVVTQRVLDVYRDVTAC